MGQLLCAGQMVCVARGGQGGRGNRRFASATVRTPFLAEEGASGESVLVWLEERQPLDVAVVGAANTGKSTLLQRISRAKPRVDQFPFTTVEPVVGVVERGLEAMTVMEVPGLIRDADGGEGLGVGFLRQLDQAAVFVYLLDGGAGHLVCQYRALDRVIRGHAEELLGRHRVVVVNKVDDAGVRESVEAERGELEGAIGGPVYCMATGSGEGVERVVEAVRALVSRDARGGYVGEETVEAPRPVEQVLPEVVREGGEFVVRCWSAERVANVVDLHSWPARMQFHRYLSSLGVIRELERAGVSAGDVVRIGKAELEWQ